MNVLLRMNLIEPLVDEIRRVDEKVQVVRTDSEEEALEVMPDIEVVCGEITRALFARREKLAWIQSWGAGVDGLFYPELVESDVVLCSAKGTVGCAPGRPRDGAVALVNPRYTHRASKPGLG